MVPQNHIKEMNFFLKNMLGLFYGRVYYNLFNWYKLTSILPGYKFNRQFMETMMGTSESLGDEIAERIKPPKFHNSFGSRVRKFLTGFKFFYFHLNIQNIVDTAKAGELLGMKLIYLEAGSGALHPITKDIISSVKQELNIPLIVGGGIKSKTQLDEAYDAGADMVVIGTAFEEDESFFNDLG